MFEAVVPLHNYLLRNRCIGPDAVVGITLFRSRNGADGRNWEKDLQQDHGSKLLESPKLPKTFSAYTGGETSFGLISVAR